MSYGTTSSREIRDLLIAWLGISFAFSLAFRLHVSFTSVSDTLVTLLVPFVIVGSGFVLHELLHKFSAQHFGFWSEFRANYTTLVLSILFAAFTGIVFAAPGATMIYGPSITKRQNGIISAAGPLLNLALAGLYLPLWLFGNGMLLRTIGLYGVEINIWLSAFNLLPIGVLDGRKVLDWGLP
ncbi:MAG: site-2 protease family protein, partial [Euryarchaeota archaeon]|nr:site-2 protease family protein [Euryarchaeota archaeon]